MRLFLDRVASERFAEPVAKQLAMFLNSKRDDILDMIARAEHFAALLQALPPPNVLCHADIHGGNLMISPAGPIYLVDWDAPVFAPKERDLMFIGGGLGFAGCSPRDDVRLFYPGYGPVVIDAHALAYYRYERIVQDLVAYCDQLLLSDTGGEDRALALRYVRSNFEANGTLAMARAVDPSPTIDGL